MTMCPGLHVANFYNKITYILENNIQGAVVECGTWKGALICGAKKMLKSLGDTRNVYAFDSFEGLPVPDDRDFHTESNFPAIQWFNGLPVNERCYATLDEFKANMRGLGLEEHDILIKKGWFENTCKDFPEQIAILRFDGDWYKSTMDVLINLYDKVVPGGILIFDDYYYWHGNKQAVDEFLQMRNINVVMNQIDNAEMWFVKP